jgi:hypothetical protein
MSYELANLDRVHELFLRGWRLQACTPATVGHE